MSREFDLFAACQPGLEPLLAGEVQGLGATPEPLPGGVAFRGGVELALRAGLWIGTASHLLLRVASFRCRALGELQRKASEVPFGRWLRRGVPVDVHATARGSRVYHTGAIVERIENALTAALGALPPRPNADGDGAHDAAVARLHVRFRDDVCTISLDATSTPLHRRGYRLDVRKAPLREDLAHALVLQSGVADGVALLDPFCGSGTIAIEAAALLRGLPPGRLRPPPLEHLALFDPEAWQHVLEAVAPRPLSAPIFASDRDAGAVEATRQNAERAGVAADLTVAACAFGAHPWLTGEAPPRGVVVSNPPFGVRVHDDRTLRNLYQAFGHRAANLGDGWTVTLLAHDVRLARRTGLPLTAEFSTRLGGLSVTALRGPAARPAPRSVPDAS